MVKLKNITHIFIVLCCLFSINIYADTSDLIEEFDKTFYNSPERLLEITEELEKNLPTIKSYPEKINVFLKIIEYYHYYTDMSKYKYYLDKGFSLSKRNKNYKIEFFHLYKAIYMEWQGEDFKKALKNYKSAIKYGLLHENRKVLFTTYNHLGDNYSLTMNAHKALENYRKAENFIDNVEEHFFVKQGIALLFYYLGIYDLAEEELLKCLEAFNNWKEESVVKNEHLNLSIRDLKISTYDMLINIKSKQKEYGKSLYYAEKNLNEVLKTKDQSAIFVAYVKLSFAHIFLNQLGKTEMYMKEAENILQKEKFKDIDTLYNYYMTKYYYYLEKKDYIKSEKSLLKLIEMLEKENKNGVERISDRISNIKQKNGKIKEALYYQNMYIKNYYQTRNEKESSLSLFLHESYKESNLIKKNNQLEKDNISKTKSLDNLEEDSQNKSLTIILNVGVSIIVLLSIILFVLLYVKNRKIANRNDLTNTYNRRYIFNILEKSIKKKEDFSIILLDIDFFKSINDTYGHETGDLILIELTKLLKNNISKNEILARIGGEEFLIYTKSKETLKIAEKLRRKIEENIFDKENQKLKITSSFGIREYENRMSVDILYNEADKYLYEAKRLGRNKVVNK